MRKLILLNAIIYAVLIIGSAVMFKEHPNYNYLFFGLIMAATITQGLLVNHSKKFRKKCDWQ
jgi:hypothetical protein